MRDLAGHLLCSGGRYFLYYFFERDTFCLDCDPFFRIDYGTTGPLGFKEKELIRTAEERSAKPQFAYFGRRNCSGFSSNTDPNPRINLIIQIVYEGQQDLSAETRAVPDRPILSLATLKERLLLWKRSFQMVQKRPLIGVGTGQWKIILPFYGKIDKFEETQGEITEIQFVRPHNDFLWVLAENGWAGFILYLGFFLALIIYALRIMLNSQDLYKTLFSVLMLFGMIGYMIIASFSFPKERIFHSIFLILIAASVVSTYHQVFPKPRQIGCRKIRSLEILIAIFLIFSVFVGIVRFNSEVHTRNALAARQSDDWELVIHEIDRADSWFYTLDPTSTPLMWYRGMANFLQGHRENALGDFKKAYEHHPNHIHVLNNLGTCYALLQHPEIAIEFYRKALEISPGFERCLINLRTLEEATEKHRGARDISRRANL